MKCSRMSNNKNKIEFTAVHVFEARSILLFIERTLKTIKNVLKKTAIQCTICLIFGLDESNVAPGVAVCLCLV